MKTSCLRTVEVMKMSNDKFWNRMEALFEDMKDIVEDENSQSRRKLKQIKQDQNYHIDMTNRMENKLPEGSTWERLREDEDFQGLSEKVQKVIWELAKIEMGDSPKTQSEVADQYGIDNSRVSQLKQKLGDFEV